MNTTVGMACKLLCASESAYAISTSGRSGQYNPVNSGNSALYGKQYAAIGFVVDPFVVISAQIEAALVGKTSSEIIVAFRGTLAPAKNWDSFFDWLQDFWAEPTSNHNLPGEVHSGFLVALMGLADGIRSAIEALDPGKRLPIYITGHSKGGGMAPIAAMYFKNAFGIHAAQTITFAGPRPGNADFCTAYNAAFPNDLRYENYLDIVPLLPPTPTFIEALELLPLPAEIKKLLQDGANWNYNSVGTLEYIDKNGVAKSYGTIGADLLSVARIAEIAASIATGDISAVANAHHASCNHGYMNGTCPITVCQ